jgi:rubrerythrin
MTEQQQTQQTTVGDVKIQKLLDRLAMQERRHSSELMDIEIQYLIEMNALQGQIIELRARYEIQEVPEPVELHEVKLPEGQEVPEPVEPGKSTNKKVNNNGK